jgi:formamidopyrimidine-DNA glycosylase
MIELPEALTIAEQMNNELKGRRIAFGNRGNSPHKFAFCSGSVEEYEAIFNGAYLTVTVQGWGNTLLLPRAQAGEHPHVQEGRITPLTNGFTWEYFRQLFDQMDKDSKTSVKYFVISEPGVWGIGNGCLQDILFCARLHPKRRVVDTTKEERRTLYAAVQDTLQQMVNLGGRDSERDLYNRPGGYRRILDSKTVGQPCPDCATPIEKTQYLGGAAYFCPQCQV